MRFPVPVTWETVSQPHRTRPVERYTVDHFLKEKAMTHIPGRLLANLFPDGTVRIVFLVSVGGGNEAPLMAKNPDAAEIVFMTCGLKPEGAAELRAELERNKVVSVETSVDDVVAEKFRHYEQQRHKDFVAHVCDERPGAKNTKVN
jgi:hypothetical protein